MRAARYASLWEWTATAVAPPRGGSWTEQHCRTWRCRGGGGAACTADGGGGRWKDVGRSASLAGVGACRRRWCLEESQIDPLYRTTWRRTVPALPCCNRPTDTTSAERDVMHAQLVSVHSASLSAVFNPSTWVAGGRFGIGGGKTIGGLGDGNPPAGSRGGAAVGVWRSLGRSLQKLKNF